MPPNISERTIFLSGRHEGKVETGDYHNGGRRGAGGGRKEEGLGKGGCGGVGGKGGSGVDTWVGVEVGQRMGSSENCLPLDEQIPDIKKKRPGWSRRVGPHCMWWWWWWWCVVVVVVMVMVVCGCCCGDGGGGGGGDGGCSGGGGDGGCGSGRRGGWVSWCWPTQWEGKKKKKEFWYRKWTPKNQKIRI